MVGQVSAVREGTPLFDQQGNQIGVVTSGTSGPTAGKPVSMAYVSADFAAPETEVLARSRVNCWQ
ncbi:glycine cleavage T C-terminal barrel domain-containing protein [Vibrio sp. PP-XX7]